MQLSRLWEFVRQNVLNIFFGVTIGIVVAIILLQTFPDRRTFRAVLTPSPGVNGQCSGTRADPSESCPPDYPNPVTDTGCYAPEGKACTGENGAAGICGAGSCLVSDRCLTMHSPDCWQSPDYLDGMHTIEEKNAEMGDCMSKCITPGSIVGFWEKDLNTQCADACDESTGCTHGFQDQDPSFCPVSPPSFCGNGVKEGEEQCDDGTGASCVGPFVIDPVTKLPTEEKSCNDAPDSLCRANCTERICGDAIPDPGEDCDLGSLGLATGCKGDPEPTDAELIAAGLTAADHPVPVGSPRCNEDRGAIRQDFTQCTESMEDGEKVCRFSCCVDPPEIVPDEGGSSSSEPIVIGMTSKLVLQAELLGGQECTFTKLGKDWPPGAGTCPDGFICEFRNGAATVEGDNYYSCKPGSALVEDAKACNYKSDCQDNWNKECKTGGTCVYTPGNTYCCYLPASAATGHCSTTCGKDGGGEFNPPICKPQGGGGGPPKPPTPPPGPCIPTWFPLNLCGGGGGGGGGAPPLPGGGGGGFPPGVPPGTWPPVPPIPPEDCVGMCGDGICFHDFTGRPFTGGISCDETEESCPEDCVPPPSFSSSSSYSRSWSLSSSASPENPECTTSADCPLTCYAGCKMTQDLGCVRQCDTVDCVGGMCASGYRPCDVSECQDSSSSASSPDFNGFCPGGFCVDSASFCSRLRGWTQPNAVCMSGIGCCPTLCQHPFECVSGGSICELYGGEPRNAGGNAPPPDLSCNLEVNGTCCEYPACDTEAGETCVDDPICIAGGTVVKPAGTIVKRCAGNKVCCKLHSSSSASSVSSSLSIASSSTSSDSPSSNSLSITSSSSTSLSCDSGCTLSLTGTCDAGSLVGDGPTVSISHSWFYNFFARLLSFLLGADLTPPPAGSGPVCCCPNSSSSSSISSSESSESSLSSSASPSNSTSSISISSASPNSSHSSDSSSSISIGSSSSISPPATHVVCTLQGCAVITGAGSNDNRCPDHCPVGGHTVCPENTRICTAVPGEGTNVCTTPGVSCIAISSASTSNSASSSSASATSSASISINSSSVASSANSSTSISISSTSAKSSTSFSINSQGSVSSSSSWSFLVTTSTPYTPSYPVTPFYPVLATPYNPYTPGSPYVQPTIPVNYDYCGDGTQQPQEQCDDGVRNGQPGSHCTVTCLLASIASCRNGVVDAGEECDLGAKNGRPGSTCTDRCQRNTGYCGDGILESALNEQCDLGKQKNGQTGQDCDGQCQFIRLAACGDGKVDPSFEQCDNGAQNGDTSESRCRSNCVLARCGDYILDFNEECDDGNNILGDGCSAVCTIENAAAPPLSADLTAVDAILRSSLNPSPEGRPVTFTYTMRLGNPALRDTTGDVQFTDERTNPPTVLGTAPLSNYTASLTTSSLSPGIHSILGTYLGDATHKSVPSNIVIQHITVGTLTLPSPARASTGPELVIFLASGAAAGYGLMRRRFKQ